MARKKKKKGLSFNNISFQGHPCPIKSSGITDIHYTDVEFLKMFLTEKGKIMPRRITGVSASCQKDLTLAIKRARNLALLSFSEGYIAEETEHEVSTNTKHEGSPAESPQETTLTDEKEEK